MLDVFVVLVDWASCFGLIIPRQVFVPWRPDRTSGHQDVGSDTA